MRFNGRVALVTGGAKGIGLAVSHLLADEGACVLIADTDVEAGAATAQRLVEEGRRAHFVHVDVTCASAVEELVRQAVRDFCGLDVLVNNAGIAVAKSTVDTSEAEWDRVIRVNLRCDGGLV